MSIQLPYTLQTTVGMVQNRGAPIQRTLPRNKTVSVIHNPSDANDSKWTFPEIHIHSHLGRYSIKEPQIAFAAEFLQKPHEKPERAVSHRNSGLKRYEANLGACLTPVTKEDLKGWMRNRTRFDLEQAAAVVVAAFLNDGRKAQAARLVRELGVVLTTSCMWVEDNAGLPVALGPLRSPHKLAQRLQMNALKWDIKIPVATSYAELVPLLMRVRRSKPDHRCLHIPQWMFKEAGIDAPSPFKEFLGKTRGSECPVSPRQTDSIILSRRHFRYFQREIYHLFKFWDSNINLRKRIKKLEDNVLYGGDWVRERVFDLDNLPLLCHYFFYYQRRLQKKVVSNSSGYGFLQKGEGNAIFQNNVAKKSSFERVLLNIAESNEDGIIVATSEDNTMVLMEETCRLMKEYVDIYGGGRKENLAFKPGQRGGSGRGPVDDYNLLCDILGQLKANARDEGIQDVPGPVRKFLAKDIMSWNNAWKDDAFAPGFIPGWETWLDKRGSTKREQLVEGEEDWEFVSW